MSLKLNRFQIQTCSCSFASSPHESIQCMLFKFLPAESYTTPLTLPSLASQSLSAAIIDVAERAWLLSTIQNDQDLD